MMDKIGKIFIAQGSHSKCAVCNVLMSLEASRVHSTQTCYPAPPACPPFSYGVLKGEA
jgi:hypothetical protein